MADSPLPHRVRPKKANASKTGDNSKKVSVSEFGTRLELAFGQVPIPADLWSKICKVLLPEEYEDSGLPSSPMVHLPHSLSRMDEYMKRAREGVEICHPRDIDFADGQGVLPEYDFDRPSGTLAPKRLGGEAVGYEAQALSGEDRAELPECSDRLIRDGGEARKARQKDNGQAAVQMLRQVFNQNRPAVESFPERLRAARKRRGWTLRRVANKTGCTLQYISLIELGARRPSYGILKALAHLFGGSNLTVADILLSPWPD